MRYRILVVSWLALMGSTASMAQTTEYSRNLSGSLDVSPAGRVSTYDLQSAGTPAIDQGLGSLVESWQFEFPAGTNSSKANPVEFVVTVIRSKLSEDNYTVKRVEFFPANASPKARRAQSAEELSYCQQTDVPARTDIICPAILPNDAALSDAGVSAEVFVAIQKTSSEPQVAVESVYLYNTQNTKLLSKTIPLATNKYSDAAFAWAKKNSMAFLQDREVFMARVEFVQFTNKAIWRRHEKAPIVTPDWVNDDFRAKTKYVSQAGWVISSRVEP